MAEKKILKLKLKSFEHQLIDKALIGLLELLNDEKNVSGPIPLPVERSIVTIIKSPHKYKTGREQFETRKHKRLIQVVDPKKSTIDNIMSMRLPIGVELEIKV